MIYITIYHYKCRGFVLNSKKKRALINTIMEQYFY